MAKATIFLILTPFVALSAAVFALTGKPPSDWQVRLSRPALYALTHDDDDAAQLVDGKIVGGTMWQSGDGVGWIADGRPITLDFQNTQRRVVDRACLHLGQRGDADAYFPQSLDVFSVDAAKGALWLGAVAADGSTASPDYLAKWFCVSFQAHRPDAIRIIIRPAGPFLFVDEVRLTASPGTEASKLSTPVGGYVDDAERFALERTDFMQSLNVLTEAGPNTLAALATELKLGIAKGAIGRDPADLTRLRAELRSKRREELRLSAGGFNAIALDPYGETDLVNLPLLDEPRPLPLASGFVGALSAAVLPDSPGTTEVNVSVSKSGPAADGLSVRVLSAVPVLAASGRTVFDPLVPVGPTVTLEKDEPRILWLSVKAKENGPAGSARVDLTVSADDGRTVRSLSWPVSVGPIVDSAAPDTDVWGYLDSAAIAGFPRDAVADMLDHGVNTAVLPSGALPWPDSHAPPGQIGSYAKFDRTMAQLRGHKRYLFFLGLGDEPSVSAQRIGKPLYSPQWQGRFVAWIREWTERMHVAGLPADRFAFYPIDEVSSQREAELLVRLSHLIKAAAPDARIFATVHRAEFLSPALVQAVDIFQLNDGALDHPLAEPLLEAHRPVWLYRAEGGGKAADPRAFYQSLGWKAFLRGLPGFGVWSYADIGSDGSAWNDLDGARADFAMIYESPMGPLSSRRWEAWREGVQDYRLLSSAAAASASASASEGERRRVRELAEQGLTRLGRGDDISDLRSQLFRIARRTAAVENRTGMRHSATRP